MALPITALIIDDEPLARQELEYLLEAAGDVSVLAQCSNGIDAVDLIRSHRPDVVFLDVRMPGLDGFAVLKKVMALDRKTRLPQIVFATAFDQYAVKAFEVNAVDYLLKPFDSKRVVKTLEKVREQIGRAEAAERWSDSCRACCRACGRCRGQARCAVANGGATFQRSSERGSTTIWQGGGARTKPATAGGPEGAVLCDDRGGNDLGRDAHAGG
jgi:two-component system LytT family response regulator/two-component system response regulator LytT